VTARNLHPGAWWLWALGLATAASRTSNPLLLTMILAVAGCVVAARRSSAPWALGFRLYLWLGGIIVVSRIVFRIIFGGGQGDTILFTLPEIPLPAWAAGIRLFGPVALEQVLGGGYDGLRLAAMLICLGAANALANPKRMLRAVPSALYEVGAAVVVALSVAPQLVESVLRVRRARRLRGGRRAGMRALPAILIPVLEDALDRSLQLAAAMDSRGYGRRAARPARERLVTGVLVLGGLIGVCVGVYGLLDAGTPVVLGLPMLALGLAAAIAGFVLAGRRISRTAYRPDPWLAAEWAVVGCGVAVAAGLYLTVNVDAAVLYPTLSPLEWPRVSWLPLLAIGAGALPMLLAPPPYDPAALSAAVLPAVPAARGSVHDRV
jgi:energy-coupling factor transport system permease protein